jgi:DnaJ-class molecular chaperone
MSKAPLHKRTLDCTHCAASGSVTIRSKGGGWQRKNCPYCSGKGFYVYETLGEAKKAAKNGQKG